MNVSAFSVGSDDFDDLEDHHEVDDHTREKIRRRLWWKRKAIGYRIKIFWIRFCRNHFSMDLDVWITMLSLNVLKIFFSEDLSDHNIVVFYSSLDLNSQCCVWLSKMGESNVSKVANVMKISN